MRLDRPVVAILDGDIDDLQNARIVAVSDDETLLRDVARRIAQLTTDDPSSEPPPACDAVTT